MFKTKKTSLFEVPGKKTSSNKFISSGMKKAATVKSGNGAVKYSSHSSEFVTQFGKIGEYKEPRSYEDVSRDMSTLWALDKRAALSFAVYIRLITRTVQTWEGNKTSVPQRGAGLKHEGMMRMLWIAVNHPSVFWKNVQIFIATGSWRDIFHMLSLDLQYNGWADRKLDWSKMRSLILAGLENSNTSELVKKYLPRIQAKSTANTVESQAKILTAKYICEGLFGKADENGATYKKYRKLKESGKAHIWQKLISQKLMEKIDFNTIHGKALSSLVSSKFLKNNGLAESYAKWIASKPVAKYTGFVFELAQNIPGAKEQYQVDTINKQYEQLVKVAREGIDTNTKFIVVRDTSGSMSSTCPGTKSSCGDVAKGLAIFFSDMLDGEFKNHWIEFESRAKMRTFKGATFVEKWQNDKASYIGSTNFLDVANVFADIKRRGIEESEFPTGILCISDGEFNSGQLGKTNVESFKEILRTAGFSKEFVDNFTIVLWNLYSRAYGNNQKIKFETYDSQKGIFYLSGFSPETISFLTNTEMNKVPSTAEELFEAAMDQEVIKLLEV